MTGVLFDIEQDAEWENNLRQRLLMSSLSGAPCEPNALSVWNANREIPFHLLKSLAQICLLVTPFNAKYYERWASSLPQLDIRLTNAGDSYNSYHKEPAWMRALRVFWLSTTPGSLKEIFQNGLVLLNTRIGFSLNKELTKELIQAIQQKINVFVTVDGEAQICVLSPQLANQLFQALDKDYSCTDITLKDIINRSKERMKLIRWITPSSVPIVKSLLPKYIYVRSYARVGLMGNPSDGFGGKTLSMLLGNFWTDIVLVPNEPNHSQVSLDLSPDPFLNTMTFPSMNVCHDDCVRDGYDGILRLFLATLKLFYGYCIKSGLSMDSFPGFTLRSATNIPRQVGLSGSSAFITGFLRVLCRHYQVNIPPEILANLALSVEQDELGIAAGLQDRVIQTHGGLVFMDFNPSIMSKQGYGLYEKLDVNILPGDLWLAYTTQPKESGKVHSNVRERFLKGDPVVLEAMTLFASFALEAKEALLQKDFLKFANLMTRNFQTRRTLYGDAVIGRQNLRMIDLAETHGHAAKFSGSGGCIVGLWAGSPTAIQEKEKNTLALQRALMTEGFVFCKVIRAVNLSDFL